MLLSCFREKMPGPDLVDSTQRHILILQVHYYNNYLRDPKRPQMAEAPTGKPQGRRDGPHGRGPPNEQ